MTAEPPWEAGPQSAGGDRFEGARRMSRTRTYRQKWRWEVQYSSFAGSSTRVYRTWIGARIDIASMLHSGRAAVATLRRHRRDS